MANLKEYFETHRQGNVHLQLTNRVVIEGTVLQIGDDMVEIETTPHVVMLVPFTAILFIREHREAADQRAAS